MCETRDLGMKKPHWHTLIFSGETRIDMRFVCPRDVKKMLVQRGRSVSISANIITEMRGADLIVFELIRTVLTVAVFF